MGITLGSGPPYVAAVIKTDPLKLRFQQKFDLAYIINYSYVPMPPLLTVITGTFYLPAAYHEGLYYKFAEKVAEDMGLDDIAAKFSILYQTWLADHRPLAQAEHLTVRQRRFSWFT
jgi:hypothetical protein